MRDYILFLYAYSAWANERVLDACATLSTEQLTSGKGHSTADPSIRDTLVHIMSAQETWLSRWNGIMPRKGLEPDDFATVELIRQYWRQVQAHTDAFLKGVQEDTLAADLEYTTYAGVAYTFPLWQMMAHQVNHATQHRAEAGHLLTRLGHSPGDLDLLAYMREMQTG
jgi:uncharacterized damage-inducible protein DinB